MRTVWIACAIACSVPQDVPTLPRDLDGPSSHEAIGPAGPPTPPPPPAAELDPASTCGRAEVCCRAFASATPNVVEQSACAGPSEVAADPDADARCERMMVGWRAALERSEDGEVPPECSAAGE